MSDHLYQYQLLLRSWDRLITTIDRNHEQTGDVERMKSELYSLIEYIRIKTHEFENQVSLLESMK